MCGLFVRGRRRTICEREGIVVRPVNKQALHNDIIDRLTGRGSVWGVMCRRNVLCMCVWFTGGHGFVLLQNSDYRWSVYTVYC